MEIIYFKDEVKIKQSHYDVLIKNGVPFNTVKDIEDADELKYLCRYYYDYFLTDNLVLKGKLNEQNVLTSGEFFLISNIGR